MTAYDQVTYPNLCYAQSHPDRMAVIGNLFGLDPAPPDRCRVLELGCGDGGNLLPLAVAFPGSQYVGLDLAPTVIETGRQAVAELGLRNLELKTADLLQPELEGAPFDYILAHGVYSWIPAPARDALLAICRRHLAPQGIAFVSYNCLPGCHIRRIVWDLMQFHTRELADPRERVAQAVAITRFVADSMDKPDTYRQLFKDQLEQIQRHGGGHLFHDDLARINDPVYFHEFVRRAASHGLQYLAEADFFEMQDHTFSEEAQEMLSRMEDSRLTREQYLDFIKCRRFRQTLLCHHEQAIQYPPSSERVPDFHISSRAEPAPNASCPAGGTVERFAEPTGGAIEFDYPPAKAAFRLLRERWPASIPFAELWELTRGPGAAESEARQIFSTILFEAYRNGVVDFRRAPVRCARRPSERPAVPPLARWQVRAGRPATTLRGDNLRVEDDLGRELIGLLDGTRNFPELLGAFAEKFAGRDVVESLDEPSLRKRLDELASLALLEG